MRTTPARRRFFPLAIAIATASALAFGVAEPSQALASTPEKLSAVSEAALDPSSKTTADITSTEIDEIRGKLLEYDVPRSQADQLVNKLKKGEAWDSFKETAQPISTAEFNNGSEEGTIERYEDGSIIVSTLDIPTEVNESTAQPFGISQCNMISVVGATTATNCQASRNYLVMDMSFRFDFFVSGTYGQITKYYSPVIGGIGFSYDPPTFEQPRLSTVRMSTNFSLFFDGFPVGNTAWIQVDVDKNGARMSTN